MIRVLLIALVLTGCATPQPPVPEPKVVQVLVEVERPCLRNVPERPAFRFGVGPWVGDMEAAMILADDFEKAQQWAAQWEAAASGCLTVSDDSNR
jgi:hypothetical protein